MAITVIPPIPLDQGEQSDISILSTLILTIAGILDGESAIDAMARQMTDDAITSLNKTLTDASDRIDATINPPSS